MSAKRISGIKVFQNVVRRLDDVVTCLVPIPMEDISNIITVSDMPDDPFKGIFGFVSSLILW